MTMEFGHNGCDAPCTTCGDARCSVCTDVSGNAVSMLVTLPDVITQSNPDPGFCADCEDQLAITHELPLMDPGTSVSIIAQVDNDCGFAEAVDVNNSDNFCVYATGGLCGRNTVFQFSWALYVIIYRTSGGDLWAKVYYSAGYQDFIGGVCGGGITISDDFALATGATQFDCGALDHDGTFATCTGSDPGCWCTVPIDYNLTVGT